MSLVSMSINWLSKKTELLRFVESQSEEGLGKQTEDKSKKPKVEKKHCTRESVIHCLFSSGHFVSS